jgi:hypothetical protein
LRRLKMDAVSAIRADRRSPAGVVLIKLFVRKTAVTDGYGRRQEKEMVERRNHNKRVKRTRMSSDGWTRPDKPHVQCELRQSMRSRDPAVLRRQGLTWNARLSCRVCASPTQSFGALMEPGYHGYHGRDRINIQESGSGCNGHDWPARLPWAGADPEGGAGSETRAEAHAPKDGTGGVLAAILAEVSVWSLLWRDTGRGLCSGGSGGASQRGVEGDAGASAAHPKTAAGTPSAVGISRWDPIHDR